MDHLWILYRPLRGIRQQFRRMPSLMRQLGGTCWEDGVAVNHEGRTRADVAAQGHCADHRHRTSGRTNLQACPISCGSPSCTSQNTLNPPSVPPLPPNPPLPPLSRTAFVIQTSVTDPVLRHGVSAGPLLVDHPVFTPTRIEPFGLRRLVDISQVIRVQGQFQDDMCNPAGWDVTENLNEAVLLIGSQPFKAQLSCISVVRRPIIPRCGRNSQS